MKVWQGVLDDAQVSRLAPEAPLILLEHGAMLGSPACTEQHCEWIDRNAGYVAELVGACALFRADQSEINASIKNAGPNG